MSDRLDEVKALLHKHDYITVVHKYGDGCIIIYPHPKLLNDYPRLIEAFTFERGQKAGLWASTSYDEDVNKQRFVEIPEYALRIYLVCEIAACNNRIPIDPSFMVYLDEEEKQREELDDIIAAPSNEENLKKEGFLYRLVIEARNDGFPPEFEKVAETHGVGEGYNLIRKFYE